MTDTRRRIVVFLTAMALALCAVVIGLSGPASATSGEAVVTCDDVDLHSSQGHPWRTVWVFDGFNYETSLQHDTIALTAGPPTGVWWYFYDEDHQANVYYSGAPEHLTLDPEKKLIKTPKITYEGQPCETTTTVPVTTTQPPTTTTGPSTDTTAPPATSTSTTEPFTTTTTTAVSTTSPPSVTSTTSPTTSTTVPENSPPAGPTTVSEPSPQPGVCPSGQVSIGMGLCAPSGESG